MGNPGPDWKTIPIAYRGSGKPPNRAMGGPNPDEDTMADPGRRPRNVEPARPFYGVSSYGISVSEFVDAMDRIAQVHQPPPQPLNLSNETHRELYCRFEAEREVKSWSTYDEYHRLDPANLCIGSNGKIYPWTAPIERLKHQYDRRNAIAENRIVYELNQPVVQ